MAREKGKGNLQLEKSGRYTIRVGIGGCRYSQSTGTRDRAQAERYLERFLAPLGLGSRTLPLAEVWREYEKSPLRRDLARSTLSAKRIVWMAFARWMRENHFEATELGRVTPDAIAEYLADFRRTHSASTYNCHVCVLREIFRVLAAKAGIGADPWEGVRLLSDDSRSRRELSTDELSGIFKAAKRHGAEWLLLVATGTYTGMRLGDCCTLDWESVNLARSVIQVVPEKTKRHAHGRPVTIPIHPELMELLLAVPPEQRHGFVNPAIAESYLSSRWRVDDGVRRIFKASNITMSVRVKGRARRSVVASFHSLRHTFVSMSANAGAPLAAVQAIVGHCSSAMTRHYYHENEATLRRAVESIPAIGRSQARTERVPSGPL